MTAMDCNTLDGLYRATVVGLQLGTVATVVGAVARVLGIPCPCLCLLFLMTFLLGAALAHYRDTLMVQTEGKAVLVTGCDSGFGYDLALKLQKLGFVVFAGCLLADKGGPGSKQLQELEKENLHVVQLDVTSEEQLKEALTYVTKHLPPGGLWGVVNNAGWTTIGHVEWVPISTCKRIMDINVWGMLRVIQTFLPLIRRSKGRIVNVASALGRQSAINKSAYGITKYGVEALSDCLRFEMRHWGVGVAIIEPGNFVNATKCYTEESIRKSAVELWTQIPDNVQKDYTKDYFDSVINNKIKYSTMGTTDKSPVVDAMAQALLHRYPHPRYQPMEPYFKLRTWVSTHLPEWVYEKIRP